MQLAVSGASGFIGGNLLRMLASLNIASTGLLRPGSRQPEHHLGINYVRTDFTNPKTLAATLSGARSVIHAGGPGLSDIISGRSSKHEELSPLISACQHAGVKRLVYLSTLKARDPIHPDSSYSLQVNRDPYACRKRKEEQILASHSGDLEWVIIRAPVVYGPGDRKSLSFFRAAFSGMVPMIAGAEGSFSMIHVNELAKNLHQAACDALPNGAIVEVGHSEAMSWNQLMRAIRPNPRLSVPIPGSALLFAGTIADKLSAISGKPLKLTRDRALDLTRYQWISHNNHASFPSSFRESFSIHHGLSQTREWYLNAGWVR